MSALVLKKKKKKIEDAFQPHLPREKLQQAYRFLTPNLTPLIQALLCSYHLEDKTRLSYLSTIPSSLSGIHPCEMTAPGRSNTNLIVICQSPSGLGLANIPKNA